MPILHMKITKASELDMSIYSEVKPQKLVLRSYMIKLTSNKTSVQSHYYVSIDWLNHSSMSNMQNHQRLTLFADTEKLQTIVPICNWTFKVGRIPRTFGVRVFDYQGNNPSFVADGGNLIESIDLVFDYENTNRP